MHVSLKHCPEKAKAKMIEKATTYGQESDPYVRVTDEYKVSEDGSELNVERTIVLREPIQYIKLQFHSGGEERPVKTTQEYEQFFDVLNALHALLYEQEGCACGGPLHVVLDDGNMHDADMSFSRAWIEKNDQEHPVHVLAISGAILTLLESISPALRHLWWNYRFDFDFLDMIEKRPNLADMDYVEDNECELKEYVPWVRTKAKDSEHGSEEAKRS